MPWKETCVMEQRVKFITDALNDNNPVNVSCMASKEGFLGIPFLVRLRRTI
ncbi:MAG: hypothetical protein ACYS6W_09310 [Planctomycetota bacterium]